MLNQRTAPDCPVVEAALMSMSVPLIWPEVEWAKEWGAYLGRDITGHLLVDGALLANFPITVFDRTDGAVPRWPTWGVRLSGQPAEGTDRPIRTVSGIAVSCLRTLTGDWNRYRLDGDGVNNRTIFVDTMRISATDFDLSTQDQQALFDNGQAAGHMFLDRLTPEHRIAG